MLSENAMDRIMRAAEPKIYDFKADYSHLYSAGRGRVRFVEVPRLNYFMIDGIGDPASAPAYRDALNALYRCAYALKFSYQRYHLNKDYTLPPLEALWWHPDEELLPVRNLMAMKDEWTWTLMMPIPDILDQDQVRLTLEQVRSSKDAPNVEQVRIDALEEGLCAQLLHVGTYSDEAADIERLHGQIRKRGYDLRGRHHEIYLTDPHIARVGSLKMILRQPVV
jgi:hypothetical protein